MTTKIQRNGQKRAEKSNTKSRIKKCLTKIEGGGRVGNSPRYYPSATLDDVSSFSESAGAYCARKHLACNTIRKGNAKGR